MTFTDLGLAEPILRAVAEKGYQTPSPIQAKAIPGVMLGRDLLAAAQTGTGKTAAFTLPLIHRLIGQAKMPANHCRVLILTPTRELAQQVGDNLKEYSRYLKLRSTVVFGGVNINPQIAALRGGVECLVATPGRLLDLHQQGMIKFSQLDVLVLDEADRMLDMGFIHDIRRVLKLLPAKRQNLLFSATFSQQIKELAATIVNDPLLVEVAPPNTTAERVKQWLHPVDKGSKPALLSHLIRHHAWQQVLVFTRTKHGANRLVEKLARDGISALAIHGNKSQNARTHALAAFKKGEIQALVATDIAARGLDINQLPQVVNFELPNVAEDYVHRIGRTGRAGASGQAVSLVCADELKQLVGIERLIKRKIERRIVDDFEPEQILSDKTPRDMAQTDKPKSRRSGGPAKAKRDGASKRTDGDTKNAAKGRSERSNRNERGRKPDAAPSKPARAAQAGEHGDNRPSSKQRRRRGGSAGQSTNSASSSNRQPNPEQKPFNPMAKRRSERPALLGGGTKRD